MRAPRLAWLGLLSVLIVVTPLAYASPPDPIWVRGVYDDGDFDDIVCLVTSCAGLFQPLIVCDFGSLQPAIRFVPQDSERPMTERECSSLQSRAPPSSQAVSHP